MTIKTLMIEGTLVQVDKIVLVEIFPPEGWLQGCVRMTLDTGKCVYKEVFHKSEAERFMKKLQAALDE